MMRELKLRRTGALSNAGRIEALMRHSASTTQKCAGEPACPSIAAHSRVLIEFCCGPDSKLGDRARNYSKDCYIIRCPEGRNVTSRSNRMEIRNELIKAIEQPKIQPCPTLIWISIPCAGGTTWSYVNLQHESARLKVEYSRLVFEKIWSSMVDFNNLVRDLTPKIAHRMASTLYLLEVW